MDALIEDGRVHRGMIGVSVQTVTPDLAESLRLEKIGGAIVSDVQEGSPADKAGIQRRDVVIAIDGAPIADSNALRNRVAQMQPGSKARLTVVRDGREQTVTVTLGELPATAAQAGREAGGGNAGGAGLTVQPVSPDVARRLDLEQGTGVQVSNVDPSGPAAEAGFQRGDVIVEVDGVPVKSASDLRTALTKAGDRPALVLVRRNDGALYLPLNLS
jgi:S1-C subfamily serine protease